MLNSKVTWSHPNVVSGFLDSMSGTGNDDNRRRFYFQNAHARTHKISISQCVCHRGQGFVRFEIGVNAIQVGQMFSSRGRTASCKSRMQRCIANPMCDGTRTCAITCTIRPASSDAVQHHSSSSRRVHYQGPSSLEQISFAHSYIYACTYMYIHTCIHRALRVYRVRFAHMYVHTYIRVASIVIVSDAIICRQ